MAFLEDDEVSFQAALSFVEEFPFNDDSANQLLHESDASVQLHDGQDLVPTVIFGSDAYKQRRRAQMNEKRKLLRRNGVYGDPNRARNACRLEILQLREQLEQLQVDIQVLKRPRTAATRPQSRRSCISSPSLGLAAWQDLATRQRRRREDAEREHLRLKRAVQHQRQVAQSLQDLMHKRARQVAKECTSLVNQPRLTHHVVDVLDVNGDMEDFRVLFRQLEHAYETMDTLFAANGLAGMSLSADDVHMRENAGGRFLECFSHNLLPFDMDTTTEATWEHFKGLDKHYGNGSLYEKTAKDLDESNTIIENFTKELYSNSSRADIHVKQVVRKYVEDDRSAVIWVSRVAPAEIKHKILRGLTYHLRGYAVTSRSADALSVLQQCSLISLDHDTAMNCSVGDMHALKNFLVVNSTENIRVHRESIENALVDRSVARRIE